MQDRTVRTGGIDFVTFLAVVLIALKLLGVIDWPWIVVLIPAMPWILFGIAASLALIGIGLSGMADTMRAVSSRLDERVQEQRREREQESTDRANESGAER